MIYAGDLCPVNVALCKKILPIKNVVVADFLDAKTFEGMTFDIVVGNPPYNKGNSNKGTGHILWDKFVVKSMEILKENGYLCFVHPPPWRKPEHKLFDLFKSNNLVYLEIHNVKDGIKTFGCSTRYDFYVLQKSNKYQNTVVKDEAGVLNTINIREMPFIPNYNFDTIKKLLALPEEERIKMVYERSTYGADKKWVSKIKSEEFKYPVIYTINKNNEPTFRWSNTNTKGHFTISKFIFSNGAGCLIDKKGEFGLTQWAYSIEQEYDLEKLKSCFESLEFKEIINAVSFDSSPYMYLKYFKKDFYSEFK
jgi:hypothetical protein